MIFCCSFVTKTVLCVCGLHRAKQLLPIYWRPRKQSDPKCVIVQRMEKEFGAFLFVIWKIRSFCLSIHHRNGSREWRKKREKETTRDSSIGDAINSIEMHFKTNCSSNETHLPSHIVCFTPCFFFGLFPGLSLALPVCVRMSNVFIEPPMRYSHVVSNEKH